MEGKNNNSTYEKIKKTEMEKKLNKIFQDINADPLIKSILEGDFELVEDIKEENKKDDLKISFSFKHKNDEFLNSYLDTLNSVIYKEVENDLHLPELLKEGFGLEVDGDKKLISPTFFIPKDSTNFNNWRAEAILALRDIKKILGLKSEN